MSSHYHRPVLSVGLNAIRAVLAVALLMLTYKSIAPTDAALAVTHIDKVLHILAYAILTILMALSWPRLSLGWILGLTAFYGGSLEVIQALSPFDRTGSIWDMAANIIGILSMLTAWILFVRLKRISPSS